MKLSNDFFLRTDVVQIAQDLIGKVLVTNINGVRTSGVITETEAYRAPDDRACHAYGNRRTKRTETMFAEGGRAYVYLCYGIHHLFNVVTGPPDTAHAVLIRGIEPLDGLEHMLQRRSKNALAPTLSNGPGTLSQALSITTTLDGTAFADPDATIWIEENPNLPPDSFEIAIGTRIGVDYAGECATRLWRFWLKGSKFIK